MAIYDSSNTWSKHRAKDEDQGGKISCRWKGGTSQLLPPSREKTGRMLQTLPSPEINLSKPQNGNHRVWGSFKKQIAKSNCKAGEQHL